MAQCPHCRGELIYDTTEEVWIVVFSTLTTEAAELDTSSFVLFAVLDNQNEVEESLSNNSGLVVGDRTVFTWTLGSEGTPVSARLEVEHDTLGTLTQSLTVSEQSAAA